MLYRITGSIKLILIQFLLIFIPLWLEWNVPNFLTLVLLSLVLIIYLYVLSNSNNDERWLSVQCDMVVYLTEYSWFLVIETIGNSTFNHKFTCIYIGIGLAMLIISMAKVKETSILQKISYFWENSGKLIIIAVLTSLVILAINNFLIYMGLLLPINISSFTFFLYTFIPRAINVKLIVIFIYFSINKKLELDHLCLSLSSVIFIIFFSSVNYYYIIPVTKEILPILVNTMSLGLTKLNHSFTRICDLVLNFTKNNNSQSLTEGIYNIFRKLPIMGRYLKSFSYDTNYNDRSSPFRFFYHGLMKYKVNTFSLIKLNKFIAAEYRFISQVQLAIPINLKFKLNNAISLYYHNSSSVQNILKNIFCKNYNLDVICSDYKLQLAYPNIEINFLSNKENNYSDLKSLYDPLSNNNNFIANLGKFALVNAVENNYKSELDFLKYHPTAPNHLTSYTINSLQMDYNLGVTQDSDIYDESVEDVFPPNILNEIALREYKVNRNFEHKDVFKYDIVQQAVVDSINYTDSDRKGILIIIAKHLYAICESSWRFLDKSEPPFPFSKISEMDTSQHHLFPDRLRAFVMLKSCIDEGAVFKYDKINLFIYAMLLDHPTLNGSDVLSMDPLLGPTLINEVNVLTRMRSKILWMKVSGAHWMSTKGLNIFPRDNRIYFEHIFSGRDPNVNPYALLCKPIPQKPFINYR